MALPQFQPGNRDRPQITARSDTPGFNGLNNVADPLTLGREWFARADNVLVDGDRKLRRAPGIKRRTTNTAVNGAYATNDLQRLYLVDSGSLIQINEDWSTSTLASGLSSEPMRFTEVNGLVFFANGIDYGVIGLDGTVRPWGIRPPQAPATAEAVVPGTLPPGIYQVCCTLVDSRGQESGNSDVLLVNLTTTGNIVIRGIEQRAGYSTRLYVTGANEETFKVLTAVANEEETYACSVDELGEELLYPWANQPHGILPAHWGSRMYLADSYPALDASVVWRSFPLHYHLFDDGGEGITVPGRVLMMFGVEQALIIGTERGVYAWDGAKLDLLAPYGALPGAHPVLHRGQVYFWTLRGACRALPFENLTEKTVSFAPGTSAAAAMIEADGYRRYFVAVRRAGEPYNARRPLSDAIRGSGQIVLLGAAFAS